MNDGVDVARPVPGGPLGHGLHVTAGAERATRTGKHHAADRVIGLDFGQNPLHGGYHRLGHRVPAVRPVHGQDRDALVHLGEQISGPSVKLSHAAPPPAEMQTGSRKHDQTVHPRRLDDRGRVS